MEIGLGWVLRSRNGRTLHWHNGGTGGYRSFLGFDLEAQAGVVVLSNSTDSVDDLGFHLLDSRYRLVVPPALRETVEVDPALYDDYVGRYRLDEDVVVTVTRQDDRLFVQLTGQPRLQVLPESGTRYFLRVVDTQITFGRAAGGAAAAFACDVSEFDNCERLVNEVREALGPVEVLVNNAALTYFIPVVDFPVNKWLRSTAVNFHAPFYLSKLVLPEMIERGAGSIVNVSSGAAIGPGRGPYLGPQFAGGSLYGAEKAALERFTQGLASEVYRHGVSVTCYSPSQIVPTPGVVHHRLMEGRDPNEAETVETMARAALLLATEPLDRVTGRVTYSQAILEEFGWIETARGLGTERQGSGYSMI